MLAHAKGLNLENARRRATGELRAAQLHLDRKEDEQDRAVRAQARARLAASKQGVTTRRLSPTDLSSTL